MCTVLRRPPSPSPGGAGPVWSNTRVPAGEMEAAAPDVFRNLQRSQCDRLRRVHKGTKGNKQKIIIIIIFFSLTLQILKWVASAFLSCNFSVALYCHLLEKVFNVHMQPRGMRNKQVCPGSLFLQAIFVMHTYVSSNYIFILF